MANIIYSIFHSVRTHGIYEYYKSFSQAGEVYRASLPKLPPVFIETRLKEPTAPLPRSYEIGFHGTGLSRVQDQIKKGVLENRQMAFYIAPNPFMALIYSMTRADDSIDKGVVLEIRYNTKYEGYNSLFNTFYFVPGEGERTAYITAVLERNPEYITALSRENIGKYEPSAIERVRKMHELTSRFLRAPQR